MENQHHSYHPLNEDVKTFLTMDPGPKKNLLYNSSYKGRQHYVDSFLIKDGIFYGSAVNYKITRTDNNKYFLRQISKYGFTVQPSGKMNVWFGKKLTDIITLIDYAIKFKQLDWYKPYHNLLISILTPTVLGKILAGKVTNPIDMCKAIISSKRWKGLSPKYLLDYFNMLKTTSSIGYNPHEYVAQNYIIRLGSIVRTCQDPNHALERFVKDYDLLRRVDIFDIVEQAIILDRKINYKWSEKRFNTVHKDWTNEIMVYEADKISNEPYVYADIILDTPIVKDHPSIKPILNDRDLFVHAKLQHHCVYTNYSNKIKKGYYLAFEVYHHDNVYTMGVYSYKGESLHGSHSSKSYDLYMLDQVRTRFNVDAPTDVKNICIDFLKTFNKQVKASKIIKLADTLKKDEYVQDDLPW